MNMLQENNWLLSVGTFLPLLGVVVMMHVHIYYLPFSPC